MYIYGHMYINQPCMATAIIYALLFTSVDCAHGGVNGEKDKGSGESVCTP
jgi:hypothetical protein